MRTAHFDQWTFSGCPGPWSRYGTSGVMFSEENMSLPPIIRTILQPLLAILLFKPCPNRPPLPSLTLASVGWISTGCRGFQSERTISGNWHVIGRPTPRSRRRAKAESYFLATPSPTTRSYQTIFLASHISTAASMGRPRLRCWCVSARM
jgi:hypothetical protein